MNKYEELSKIFNFKVGDIVKVLFKVPKGTFGWANSWPKCMDNLVGGTFEVLDSRCSRDHDGVYLHVKGGGGNYYFPCFCLELVKKHIDKTIIIRGKEFSEDTIASALKEYIKDVG